MLQRMGSKEGMKNSDNMTIIKLLLTVVYGSTRITCLITVDILIKELSYGSCRSWIEPPKNLSEK